MHVHRQHYRLNPTTYYTIIVPNTVGVNPANDAARFPSLKVRKYLTKCFSTFQIKAEPNSGQVLDDQFVGSVKPISIDTDGSTIVHIAWDSVYIGIL